MRISGSKSLPKSGKTTKSQTKVKARKAIGAPIAPRLPKRLQPSHHQSAASTFEGSERPTPPIPDKTHL